MSAKVEKPPRPRRSWRRRLLRAAVILAALILVLRVTLVLSASWLLRFGAGFAGLDVECAEIHTMLFVGQIEIRGLTVRPVVKKGEPRPEPLAAVDFLYVDVAMLPLLRGKLHLQRVELDGIRIEIEKSADGSLNWARAFPKGKESAPPASKPAEPAKDAPRELFQFASPIAIDALRIQHLSTHLRDLSAVPAVDATALLDVRLSGLGEGGIPFDLDLNLSSPQVLRSFKLEAQGNKAPGRLDGRVSLSCDGLRLKPLTGILTAAGIVPRAAEISFGAEIVAKSDPRPDLPGISRGEFELRDVRLAADGVTAFSLASLAVRTDALSAERMEGVSVEIAGVRAEAERLPSGALRAAGLEFGGAPAAAQDSPAPPPPPAPSAGPSFLAGAATLSIRDVSASLKDGTVTPAAALAVDLDELSVRGFPLESSAGDLPSEFLISMRAPNIAESLKVGGHLARSGARSALDLTLVVDGISLEAIAPHLRAAGLASEMKQGTLQLSLRGEATTGADGRIEAAGALENLRLFDGAPLFGLEKVEVKGVVLDPAHGLTRIGDAEIGGIAGDVRIDKEGFLHLPGIRTVDAEPSQSAPSQSAPTTQPKPPAPATPTTLEVGQLTMRNTAVRFVDELASPTLLMPVRKLDLRVTGFSTALGSDASKREPAKLSLELAAEGILDKFTVEGTAAQRPGFAGVTAHVAVRGSGIRTSAFSPHLRKGGIDFPFEEGSLAFDVDGVLRGDGGDLMIDGRLRDFSLRERDKMVFGVEALTVKELRIGEGLHAASVAMTKPDVFVTRGIDGVFTFGPLRLVATEATVAPASAPAATAPDAAPSKLAADVVTIEGMRVRTHDEAFDPPVDLALDLKAKVEGFDLTSGAPPWRFDLTTAAAGVFEELSLRGEASVDPARTLLKSRLALRGLTVGPAVAYLPSSMLPEFVSGALEADLEARSSPAEGGGRKVSADVRSLALTDRDAPRPLLQLDRLGFDAARLDPRGGIFDVREFELSGLEVTAERPDAASIRALGFRFDGMEAAASSQPQGKRPVRRERKVPASERGPLPVVKLEKISVGVRRAELIDRAVSGRPPIVARFDLASLEPLSILKEQVDDLPPIKLRMTGSVEELVRNVEVDIRSTPFAPQAIFSLALKAEGIQGEGLTRLVPSLAEKLDGRELTDGELRASFHASVIAPRRQPLSLKLPRSMTAELALEDFELRDRPGGQRLASLGSIYAEFSRIDAERNEVRIRNLQVIDPQLRIRRDKDGFHALGFLLKEAPPAAGSGPSTIPAPAPPPQPESGRPLDLSIRRFVASGLDFEYVNETVEPKIRIPLNSLDVDVRDLSSRALVEPHPVRFRVYLGAGDVSLPVRDDARFGIIRGIFGAVEGLNPLGSAPAQKLEERPLFDEISMTGDVSLAPTATGSATIGVSGLELTVLHALAERASVDIEDGVLDSTTKVQFEGAQGTEIRAKLNFAHLSVSEPLGGPISRVLVLPLPLDSVISLLRDNRGDLPLSFDFRMREGSVSTAAVWREGTAALSSAIAKAISNAPFRIFGLITNNLGLTGGAVPRVEDPNVNLGFDAGSTSISPVEVQQLERLAVRMCDDATLYLMARAEMRATDIRIVDRLANPSPADALLLSSRLRQRRATLIRERQEATAALRVLYATNREMAIPDATARLVTIERDIGLTERALDSSLQLLRPFSERWKEERVRRAAGAMGRERLVRVQAILAGFGVSSDRIELRPIHPSVLPELEGEPDAGGRVALTLRRRR